MWFLSENYRTVCHFVATRLYRDRFAAVLSWVWVVWVVIFG